MQKPDIQELSDFLIDYVRAMGSIGTYSSRVNRCAKRIAETFGYTLTLNFSFAHINVSIVDPQDYSSFRSYLITLKPTHLNFSLVRDLSALSWAIYDHIHDLRVAKRCFKKLIRIQKRPFYYYIILQSIANAALSRLFEGDFGTMIIVLFATLLGTSLRVLFTYMRLDERIQCIICSFLSSYLTFWGTKFDCTQTPEVALGTSILYLIPGVFFINSVIDILQNYIQIGISRITNVAIIISCVAIGVYATLTFSNFRFL
ncbi:hypothetical protein DMB92_07165 [Campylobacter sp. MIT 99-7217]|uniref:threonine/serine ThrE exporter family protein n=1 Tax=Campylobacter sp. MIT 99-7217 TaxID=535091 RepID=UPI0011595695|nr:threonine/serine exporter family protein [Campylobacter sp. MIT 99-7217]TQR30994.1 hypothetical protein DMB92_07165 [Campylobacter sp. MIT 99-7217]